MHSGEACEPKHDAERCRCAPEGTVAVKADEVNPDAVVRPLPGAGLVVRAGDMLMVCADQGDGADELLALFSQTAAGGADGSALVRRIAALLAGDETGLYPACAITC